MKEFCCYVVRYVFIAPVLLRWEALKFWEIVMAGEIDFATITTVINNINSLYGNLVNYTVGLILFVGAFVPAVISFFQRKQFTREYDELSKKMLSELREKVSEAEEKLKTLIAETQKVELEKIAASTVIMKNELLKEVGVVKAGAYHVQANQNRASPEICISSCAWAIPLYINGDDERNAQSIISIAVDCIGTLNKSILSESLEIEKAINRILKILRENDTNGRYYRSIIEIENGLRAAQNLEKST